MEEIFYVLIGVFLVLLVTFVLWFTAPYRAIKSRSRVSNQYILFRKYFEISFNSDPKELFKSSPNIEYNPSLFLSLIVPAYNEEKRIGKMLNDYIDFLKHMNKPFEIIIVDDGSTDQTINTSLDIGRERGVNLRVIKSPQNGGKGLAVKIGMLCSFGDYLLFADADNATKAQCIEDLVKALNETKVKGLGIAIGSRNHGNKEVIKKRDGFRNLLSLSANAFLKCIFSTSINVKDIQDTQCGFKMFTRKAARDIFRIQHIERWAFDLEIIYLSSLYCLPRLEIPIVEVPVHWVEIPGSKFSVFRDLINMFRDALLVRLLYLIKVWTIKDEVMY